MAINLNSAIINGESAALHLINCQDCNSDNDIRDALMQLFCLINVPARGKQTDLAIEDAARKVQLGINSAIIANHSYEKNGRTHNFISVEGLNKSLDIK